MKQSNRSSKCDKIDKRQRFLLYRSTICSVWLYRSTICSATTNDKVAKMRRHNYLLSHIVPAMHMVATSRFRYSAPLVSWTDAELEKLHAKWLQVHRVAWRLPPGFPSAPLMFPSADGGTPRGTHGPGAGTREACLALPDELRETCIRKFRKLCERCGCNNERELASHLAEEGRPRACPLERLFRACRQRWMEVKLPACLSLASGSGRGARRRRSEGLLSEDSERLAAARVRAWRR
jgi:hypothetical protein